MTETRTLSPSTCRARREALGLTPDDLACLSGVGAYAIAAYEDERLALAGWAMDRLTRTLAHAEARPAEFAEFWGRRHSPSWATRAGEAR